MFIWEYVFLESIRGTTWAQEPVLFLTLKSSGPDLYTLESFTKNPPDARGSGGSASEGGSLLLSC